MCLGCESCEMICSMVHDGTVGLGRSGIVVKRDNLRSVTHKLLVCQQCVDHPCYDACPKKGKAMYVNDKGVVCINEEECVGCGMCARKCVFDPPRIVIVNRKAHKCDLCSDRPEGPACVEFCPALCIGLSSDPLPYDMSKEDNQ